MLKFVPFEEIGKERWDEFCLDSNDAWFRHTSASLKFCLSLNGLNKNFSFALVEGDKILAVAPVIRQPISGEDGLFEFTMGGDPIPLPALNNELVGSRREKILKTILLRIDEIAKAENIAYARMFIDPLTKPFLSGQFAYNPFLKFGWNDVSLTANILDLSLSQKALFKNIRDTYRYDISGTDKLSLSVEFFDSQNISSEVF